MPKRALAEKRPILLASLAASLAFFALRQSPLVPEMFLIPLKGAAVGLLALYAAWRGTGRDAVPPDGDPSLFVGWILIEEAAE